MYKRFMSLLCHCFALSVDGFFECFARTMLRCGSVTHMWGATSVIGSSRASQVFTQQSFFSLPNVLFARLPVHLSGKGDWGLSNRDLWNKLQVVLEVPDDDVLLVAAIKRSMKTQTLSKAQELQTISELKYLTECCALRTLHVHVNVV